MMQQRQVKNSLWWSGMRKEAPKLAYMNGSSTCHCGATILCGGDRDGLYLTPTVLENVRKKALLHKEEAFGPVASIIPFKDYEVALAEVDDGRFGLQVGVFTESLESAMSAWEQLNVGAVIVGDVPTWRADAMPYGGTKDSGTGREGLRYAIDEMSELRLLVMRR